MKTIEERISALEVAVKFQSQQLEDMKNILLELRDKIAERQTENGVQNTTLSQHEEDLQELRFQITTLDTKLSTTARFVYIGIGIISAVVFILQVVPLFLNLMR